MTWEEACRILGVAPDATEQQIKDAYRALAQLLHPDVHQQKSEKVRKKAEEEFKKVGQAYDILKDPKKFQVQPDHITFSNVAAQQIQTAFFEVRYHGDTSGKRFEIDDTTWVTIVDRYRTSSSLTPIRVEIEVTGQDWDKSYEEYITVRLNGEEAKVKVELQTTSAPVLEVQPDHITFSNVAARQIQTASFEVRYDGDTSGKELKIDRPTWVTKVRRFSMTPSAPLPMRVEIEAAGQDWNKCYEEYVTVRFNGAEAKVKVELQTRSATFMEKVKAVLRTWRPWLKRFLAQHKKKVAWAITIPLTILIVWMAGAPLFQSSVQSAILGKWQHGLSQRPPNMGSSTYELIKGLPESKPYSLEFSKNGQLLYISEGGTHSGKYSFVGQNSVQITWSSSSSPPDLGLQDGIYEVRFSGNKMGLIQQGKKEVTFTRIE